jgi:hypothetical protein
MTDWQAFILACFVCYMLWATYRAGYGEGYQDAAREWSPEEDDNDDGSVHEEKTKETEGDENGSGPAIE